MIQFTIDGQPQRKERPRFSRCCNYVRTYTPKQTKDYEQHVRECYLNQVGSEKMIVEKPLSMEVVAFYQIPKSWSKKKQRIANSRSIYPTNRIDVDNVAKVVMDALNGIAYSDDHFIVDLKIRKLYAYEPRIEVSIFELEQMGVNDV